MSASTSSGSPIVLRKRSTEIARSFARFRAAIRSVDGQLLPTVAADLARALDQTPDLQQSHQWLDAYVRDLRDLHQRPDDERRVLLARGQRLAAFLAVELGSTEREPIETGDDLRRLRGVGPAIARALAERGIRTIEDLVHLLPTRYQDLRVQTSVRDLKEGEETTVVGEVASVHPSRRRLEVCLQDGTGTLDLVWFHRIGMGARFTVGARFRASGKVQRWGKRMQMVHPDVDPEDGSRPGVRVRYPTIDGVAPRVLEKLVRQACAAHLEQLPDGIPPLTVQSLGLPGQVEALRFLHEVADDAAPSVVEALNDGRTPAHVRLVFDELFYLQLGLGIRRLADRRAGAPECTGTREAAERVSSALPFALTRAQHRVIEEIGADLQRDTPMNRLLQGDVGSGKTAVALAAAEMSLTSAGQVLWMAPTELLAEQHCRTNEPLLARLGRTVALLTASTPRASRASLLALWSAGRIDMLIGTHSLLSEGVGAAAVGLVIVDEQHRFGVAQRARLRKKGERVPHLLVMTATPIPRSLALTLYSDLDVSLLDELPPGRRPPETRVMPEAHREEAYAAVVQAIALGGCAYVVCPSIEGSETTDLRDATTTHDWLRETHPELRVALVHGRTPSPERESIVARLRRGEIDVLVTTTLIEVGLDVPNATALLVEHADRFGLAQLHQLRGRVGRGGGPSLAIMLVSKGAPEIAQKRARVLESISDGFRIAEQDLEIRGPGELFGSRQAGLPRLRFADLRRHAKWIQAAKDAAWEVLSADPDLQAHTETARVLHSRWGDAMFYGEETG